jgi:ADP-ribose pyrophosphatase YjhB (NUDIX family)
VWVDETVLAEVRRRYGAPRKLRLEQEIDLAERELVLSSGHSGRRHDVTFFVGNAGRLALIRKPHFAPGLWRPPGGGIHPGEDFEAGALREAREELGVAIALERYLVRTDVVFTCAGERIPWQTHVVAAATEETELAPVDRHEIAEARWGTAGELAGPIRERLLATGRGLWR